MIEYDNYGLNKREGKRGTAHYYNINKAEKKPASQPAPTHKSAQADSKTPYL